MELKHKLPYREKSLERDILLFKWSGPEDFKLPLNPEFWLTEYGSLGWDLKHECWVYGVFNGILDEYGDFMTYVCHTLNTEDVKSYELKNHEEVIVCGNTPLYRPFAKEREYYSFMKEEADLSILCQVINTRLNRAFIAMNDQQKNAIMKAYKEAAAGFPLIITTSLLEDLDTVDLTIPGEVDKIQYITSFYQSMEKREANDFGIDLDNLDKRAQVSTEEIKQYDDVTTMEYLIMWEMRLRFMEEMKKAGIDINIVRNPIFFDEPTKEDVDNGTFEEAEAETETPETPEEKKETEEPEDGNKD